MQCDRDLRANEKLPDVYLTYNAHDAAIVNDETVASFEASHVVEVRSHRRDAALPAGSGAHRHIGDS